MPTSKYNSQKLDAQVRQKQGANTVDNEGVGPSNTREGRGGQFVLMRLMAGDVFPPRSGQMQGGRQRRDGSDFDQQVPCAPRV